MARIWNKHKQTNTPLKRKVFVAMSGGVDSSVAALLLKQKGYNVRGAHIISWDKGCDFKKEKQDAERTCVKLGVPFVAFDLTKEYEKEVIDYMTREYTSGRTPNPDVMCNKKIKFGAFLTKALEMGADYIATGHYIKIKSQISNPKDINQKSKVKSQNSRKIYKLLQAKDKNKDQSYFLWTLNQEQLKHCLFPIGNYLKPDVRKIAAKFNLPAAEKKDSQGLCFVGKVKFEDFLKNLLYEKNNNYKNKEGEIFSKDGKFLGRHKGLEFYTIGQRRGLCIGGRKTLNKNDSEALYVLEKDYKKNILIVGETENTMLFKKEVCAENLNWISEFDFSEKKLKTGIKARIRYRGALNSCEIIKTGENKAKIIFKKPQKAVAPGQSIVFYKGEEMIGGGIIC